MNAVFAFGRLQPPTNGHALLVDRITSIAKRNGADAFLFLSRSEDDKENPVPFILKHGIVRRTFPTVIVPDVATVKSPLDVFRWLSENKYEHVWMVAGTDRMEKYWPIVERQRTRFKTCELMVSGTRDPDADDVAGISGSKMRQFARENDFTSFVGGAPDNMTIGEVTTLFQTIRKVEGLDNAQ